ncbi:hypothetical protein CPB84DRAFT_1784426 [Gymnopilus junonius]|uniref:Uncharacterized protein n=1 Tax=Gymnopilus junonius TaxID=109634 RepID=A0A9P5NH40_GYMJU|nr:hypothetical protein CPB84DRAFT_1784426 [Gymnopilus junonius]
MIQDLGLILIGLEIIYICFLSLPISILSAIILSWIVHLPVTIRQEVEKGLGGGARFVVILVLGMLGSFMWIMMIFCATCTNDNDIMVKVTFSLGLGSIILWIVYAACTPWHPESKLSPEVLSAHTVRTGCRQILALKCLIVIVLSIMAIFILTCIGEKYGMFGTPNNTRNTRRNRKTTTPNINASEDGAAERLAQTGVKAINNLDLEAGTGSGNAVTSQLESEKTQCESKTEVINIAALDGAD